MTHILIFGISIFLATSKAFAIDTSAYDQCMLQVLRTSRSEAATHLMQRSCYALYQNGPLLLPREQAYHSCILQSLPWVKEPSAIVQIVSICSRQRQM
ncbi:VF_A0006 family four-cysteine protein [Paraburkholderia humisilvae]|nr:VF_A0006 family four-cysteine protein [Paraburkholderia humisilvae]